MRSGISSGGTAGRSAGASGAYGGRGMSAGTERRGERRPARTGGRRPSPSPIAVAASSRRDPPPDQLLASRVVCSPRYSARSEPRSPSRRGASRSRSSPGSRSFSPHGGARAPVVAQPARRLPDRPAPRAGGSSRSSRSRPARRSPDSAGTSSTAPSSTRSTSEVRIHALQIDDDLFIASDPPVRRRRLREPLVRSQLRDRRLGARSSRCATSRRARSSASTTR